MFACSETTLSLLAVHILTLPHKGVTHQSKMEGKSLLYITFIVSHFDGAGVVENTSIFFYQKQNSLKAKSYLRLQKFVPHFEQRAKYCFPNWWVCEALQVNNN